MRSGMTASRENNGQHSESRHDDGRPTWSATHARRRAISQENARPRPRTVARETDSRHHHSRCRARGGRGEGRDAGSRKWAISPRMRREERGQFLGRYQVWGVDPGGPILEEMEAARGRTEKVLGLAVSSGGTSARMHGMSETGSHPGHADRTLGLHRDGDWRRQWHPGQ